MKLILVSQTHKRAKSPIFSIFQLFKTTHLCCTLEEKYVEVSFQQKKSQITFPRDQCSQI